MDLKDSTFLDSIQSNKFNQNRSTCVYYDHCHMTNYIKGDCCQLVGYPPNHKFAKRRVVDRSNKTPGYGGNRQQNYGGNRLQNVGGNKQQNYEITKNTCK